MKIKNISIYPTEEQIQMALIEECQYYPILRDYIYHPPNGGSRSKRTKIVKGKTVTFSPEAMRLKKMGTRAGVSDLVLPYPRGAYHGFYLEAKSKRKGSRLSDEQKDWLLKMKNLSLAIAVFNSVESGIFLLKTYIKLPNYDGKTRNDEYFSKMDIR